MHSLNLSKNSKTTQKGRKRHDGRATAYPQFANSFGLPAGTSCPGATAEFCDKHCYGVETEGRTNVRNNLHRNLDLLRGKSEDEMYELIAAMMRHYQSKFDKSGLPEAENIFRIHWDGDFFSVDYARAWRNVIVENPQIKFWVYTRSFREPVNVIPELYGVKNLALYLSVDAGNKEDAKKIMADYPKILMAFCADDEYRGLGLAQELGKKHTTTCPENIGAIALMSEGKGACVHCMLCIKKRPNIIFVDSKIHDLEAQQTFDLGVPVSITKKFRPLAQFDLGLVTETI